MTHHVNKLKNKNHMNILKDTGKAFDKIQHAFRIKNSNKLCTEKIKFNTIRAIYDKPTVTITLNSEQLKAFLLRSRTKKLLLTLLSNILVEVTPIRQVKEIKRIQTGQEDVKLSLLVDNTIPYTQKILKKLLKSMNLIQRHMLNFYY